MKNLLRNILIGSMIIAGATTAFASTIPNTPALYESYLANTLGSSDVTMTIASGALRDGTSLNGFNCFTIDANTPTIEYVCGTVSGTSVSGLLRGLDSVSGTTTIASLQYAHRRGADVKITEYPTLTILSRIFQNVDTIAQAISYASGVSTSTLASNRQNLADWGLVQDTALQGSGAIAATTAAKGYVQLATNLQTASSTVLGSSGASLVVPSANATSTYNRATAPLNVVVTQNNGTIDPNFVGGIATTSTIGATGTFVQDVGKNVQVFTTTGTSTFAVPAGIHKLSVTVQAPGAPGGTCFNVSGANGFGMGGGGAGGWATKVIDVTGTSTIQLFVGATTTLPAATSTQATWSTFGTNGSYFYATGGNPGVSSGGAGNTSTLGGRGGLGVNGDINVSGQNGGGGAFFNSTGVSVELGGNGGSTPVGFGGFGSNTTAVADGQGYGSAGSGAACGSSGTAVGGQAANGIVIVRW